MSPAPGATGGRAPKGSSDPNCCPPPPSFQERTLRPTEQQIHRALVGHLTARPVPNLFWCHVPNGGWRSPIEAKIFRGLGVKAGVPDLILVKAGQVYGLEIKTERGRLSNTQRDTIEAMRAAGAIVGVAHGIDEAIAWLERHDLLRGRAS
jgi:hypothetical protein